MRETIRDASNQLSTMGAAKRTVLQTAAHHCACAAMP
jgi:hypothetical protein